METIHADGTPLAAYLEGEGYLDPAQHDDIPNENSRPNSADLDGLPHPASFAPSRDLAQIRTRHLQASHIRAPSTSSISRLHYAWSSAVNSRLRRADNARFVEHFRYIIVASQLLNEYLDQGSLPTNNNDHNGSADKFVLPSVSTSIYGAAATALAAFALVYLIHWARNGRSELMSKGRVALALTVFTVALVLGYAYIRRHWLKVLRRNAVSEVSDLTSNWLSFEACTSNALSLVQDVELVSRGYRLSSPLPPVSRVDDNAMARRCGRLRKTLHKVYCHIIPAVIEACGTLRSLIEEDDLERYFDVYDINSQDARDASGADALGIVDDDPESLKSLRVLSYRSGVLRRVTLCSLMALETDGSKTDFYRWRAATAAMSSVSHAISTSTDKVRSILADMETIAAPVTTPQRSPNLGARDKLRSQVRKISALSSGIRALQAKMQILREETSHSIEHSDDTVDLGPNLLAQYESIGTDLRELQQAWEAGKSSLQSNLAKRNSDRRISSYSNPSTAARSSLVSSMSGLTAVEEGTGGNSNGGTPADALKALSGDASYSNRSSMATSPSSDEELVFEAMALPRQRASLGATLLSREERIAKMHEERERQSMLRARREANTSMLRELESVISLRPKKGVGTTGQPRITSV